uniref:Uncharacterized protein n=1 Tax=Anguilla anguilla TaxID=7936 RepID=A0A0E9SXW8_ANGAN
MNSEVYRSILSAQAKFKQMPQNSFDTRLWFQTYCQSKKVFTKAEN